MTGVLRQSNINKIVTGTVCKIIAAHTFVHLIITFCLGIYVYNFLCHHMSCINILLFSVQYNIQLHVTIFKLTSFFFPTTYVWKLSLMSPHCLVNEFSIGYWNVWMARENFHCWGKWNNPAHTLCLEFCLQKHVTLIIYTYYQ
jgi:hypothetical protein